MPTENRSSNTEQMVACDDGLHLIQFDENSSHFGWVFRKIQGGLPYSVRKATEHEMAHAKARQHLRSGVAQIAAQHQGEPVAWTNETTLAWMRRPNSGYAQVSACAVASEPVALYLHPPTSDSYSAGDMADQGAKAFAARDGEVEQLRAQLTEWDALLRLISKQPMLNQVHRARINSALSASAELSSSAAQYACRDTWQLGTACGKCRHCKDNPRS